MKKSALVLTLALGLSAGSVMAQDAGNPPDQGQMPPPRDGGPGPGGRGHTPPIVAALDANGDGIIDADEIANAPAALLKLDKNGDGKLTADELRPTPPAGVSGPGPDGGNPPPQGMRHPASPVMKALDANGDGTIDADEIANASAALKKLDKNGDGKLTADEYRPQRPARQ